LLVAFKEPNHNKENQLLTSQVVLVNQQLHQQCSIDNWLGQAEFSFKNQQEMQQEWWYQQWRRVRNEWKRKTREKYRYGSLDGFLETVFD
jgi:hypothetical protein